MSCHSKPASRAALLLAQHATPAVDTPNPVSVREAQHSYHLLLAEGHQIPLPAPNSSMVERWFDEQNFRASLDVSSARSRNAIRTNLDEAWKEWNRNPGSISPALFHALRHTSSLASYNTSRNADTGVTVAYDCDGVLYNFNEALREWLAARGWDRSQMPEPHTYSLRESWGLEQEDLYREMPLAIDAGVLWFEGTSHQDGVDSARAVGLAGHRIVVNTARALPARESVARAATISWLRGAGVHPDMLHVSDPFDVSDKMNVHFDVLVDDHPENVRAAHKVGRQAYLVDRKWNRDHPDLPRVHLSEMPGIAAAIQESTTADVR